MGCRRLNGPFDPCGSFGAFRVRRVQLMGGGGGGSEGRKVVDPFHLYGLSSFRALLSIGMDI